MSTPENPTTPDTLSHISGVGEAIDGMRVAMQKAQNTQANAKYGGTHFYFGPQHEAVPNAAKRYDHMVLEPGHYKDVTTLSNAIAYVPLSGLHPGNATHVPLLKAIGEKGLLKDAAGKVLEDPDGPGTKLIDWRQRNVQKVMANHVKSLLDSGYKGVMFDAIDTVVDAENNDKKAHKGVVKNAMGFVEKASAYVRKTDKKAQIIFNGGVASYHEGKDVDVLKTIGKVADTLVVESQYSVGGKPRNNQDDREWLVSRLSQVVKHSKGDFNVAIVDPGWQFESSEQEQNVAKDAVTFAHTVAQEVSQQVNAGKKKNITVNASIVLTDDYENPASFSQTGQVAEALGKETPPQRAEARGI